MKLKKMTKKQKAAARAVFEANPPSPGEVVVELQGPLQSNGTQSIDAWWLSHGETKVRAQCFRTEPISWKRSWEERGFVVRILPSNFRLGEP